VSVPQSPYPELHALVDRLLPEHVDEARRTLLRLVQDDDPRARLSALPVFDGPEDLSEQSAKMGRYAPDGGLDRVCQ
jgi:hypothetical protein